jgi:hypothetical protein
MKRLPPLRIVRFGGLDGQLQSASGSQSLTEKTVAHPDSGRKHCFIIATQIDVRLEFSKELIGFFVGFVSGLESLPLSQLSK